MYPPQPSLCFDSAQHDREGVRFTNLTACDFLSKYLLSLFEQSRSIGEAATGGGVLFVCQSPSFFMIRDTDNKI